jgi:hypothetical protein
MLMMPAICFANAGIPVILISYPLMLAALIVIIPLEAFVIKKNLDKTNNNFYNFWKIFWASFWANLATTAVGFPLAWLFLLLIEVFAFVVASPSFYLHLYLLSWAWLGPLNGSLAYIMVGIATAINLVIAFFLSVWIERKIIGKKLKKIDSPDIKKAVLKANIFSYIFLVLAGAFFLYCSYLKYYGI